MADDGEPELRQELYGWQIFMITVSGVIGVTIFYRDGEALEVAGPGCTILAFAIVGLVAICVMEGISEMIQMFPAPNAIMEFVRAFVDRDLAWVVGVAYWYTYASITATQIVAAASFTDYWNLAQVWQTVGFYVMAPIMIVVINFAGVWYFGWIETIGGALKICMVFGGAIFMYAIHGSEHVDGTQDLIGNKYINEGFENDSHYASHRSIAGCFVVPIIAYGFLSLELVAVTAFEARDVRSLRNPSRIIAYFITLLYLFCVIGELLNVKWTNTGLPKISGGINEALPKTQSGSGRSGAIIIIAALKSGHWRISGLLNGCMVFSALSAANTSLFIASRTLYGMTRTLDPAKTFSRATHLRSLATVWHKTGVPMRALLVSAIAFCSWLPFLNLKAGYGIVDLLEIMSTTADVCCLVTWSSLCIAFIRYYKWLKKHKKALQEAYPEYNRWSSTSQASTFLGGLQPWPAWFGLVGCLVITFVFTTATWWSTPATFQKVAIAYGAPIVLTTLFIVLKSINRRGPVKLDDDSAVLFDTLEHLRYLKPEQQARRPSILRRPSFGLRGWFPRSTGSGSTSEDTDENLGNGHQRAGDEAMN